MTKKQEIKEHLIKYKEITPLEAINLYGATRLSAIIFTLKKDGMLITAERTKFVDRYGRPSYFSKYRLRENIQ